MATRRQVVLAVLGAVGFFLGVQFGALALLEPFQAAGYQAVENPEDPANSVMYIGVLLVATAGMLLLFRYNRTAFLRGFIVLTSGLISAYVFSVLTPSFTEGLGIPIHGGAAVGALLVIGGLLVYPEWWVIDAAGLVMGMGAAALFGISLDILPALILLVVLAVYDAISVYGTEHMLTLASGVMELRVPVLVIIPTTTGYSFIEMAEEMAAGVEAGRSDPETETDEPPEAQPEADSELEDTDAETEDEDPFARDAFFIGLGDAVIPTIIVGSATVFLETPAILGVELASWGAIGGTILGLLALLWMVLKGRAHAGLPLLNGGAILGYLVGAVAGGISIVQALGLAQYL